MVTTDSIFIIVGLSIDVFGAALIAVPDIPQLSQYHKAGRVELQLQALQTGATAATGKGFRELKDILEGQYGEPIPENIRALRIQYGEQDNRFNNLIVGLDHDWKNIYVVPHDQEPYLWIVTPFPRIQSYVESCIEKRRSHIRGIGILVLVIGFLIQISVIVL